MRKILQILFRDEHDTWTFLNVAGRLFFRFFTVALLVKVLSTDDMALWYVFIAVFGVSAILEGGVKLVVTRQVAQKKPYAVGSFIIMVKRIYTALVLVVCIFASLAGSWWFTSYSLIPLSEQASLLWIAFVVANGIGLLSGIQSGIISGLGYVAKAQKNELAGSMMNALAFFSLWFAGIVDGLGLPIVSLLVSAVAVWILNTWLLDKLLKHHIARHLSWHYARCVSTAIYADASKMVVTLLSYHGLTSIFLLLLASYQPTSVVASFGLSMQLLSLVLNFSIVWVTASFPRLSAMTEISQLRKEFVSMLSRSFPVLLVGIFSVSLFGPWVVLVLRGENILLQEVEWWLLAFMLLSEATFAMVASFLQSQGMFSIVAGYSFWFAVVVISTVYLAMSWWEAGLAMIFLLRWIIGVIFYATPIALQTRSLLQRGKI